MSKVKTALSVAKRRYPTSEFRGRSREDPMPKGLWPRGVTHVRGQGQQPTVPGCNGAETAEKSYPSLRSRAVAERSYPTPPCLRPGVVAERSYPKPEARGGSWEEQPHIQGAVAAREQEGLEELSHVEGQEGCR